MRPRPCGTFAAAAALAVLAGCGDAAPGAAGTEASRGTGEAASADASPGAGEATGPALLPPVTAGHLEVASAAVAEPVTGERAALYLVVRNRGGAPDALLELSTPVAGRSGLHRTVREGGMSAMRAADSLAVPAGGEARLAPGGFHGMLEELTAEVTAGDTVALTLRFRRADDVQVRALVVPYAALDALYPAQAESDHAAHGGGGA